MSWNWTQPTIRIPPKSDSPKHIVAATKQFRPHNSDCAVNNGPAYPVGPCDCGAMEPSPKQIALFCRTFRLLNGDQEPDPKGSLAEVWSWLLTHANHGL